MNGICDECAKSATRLGLLFKVIASAGKQAGWEQGNPLTSCLVEAIRVRNEEVLALTPRAEFRLLVDTQYEWLPD